jgi:excinuclease UvrABC nuclease subunit
LVENEDGYYSIALVDERLPRLLPYRPRRANTHLKGAAVAATFGPYVSWRQRDRLLDFVVDRFRLRTCDPLPREPCLRLHLGTCSAPCSGDVTPQAYGRAVRAAVAFLGAPPASVVDEVRAAMTRAAAELRFEHAAQLKLLVDALEAARQPQVVDRARDGDEAVVCAGDAGDVAAVAVVRAGELVSLEVVAASDADAHGRGAARAVPPEPRSTRRALVPPRLSRRTRGSVAQNALRPPW